MRIGRKFRACRGSFSLPGKLSPATQHLLMRVFRRGLNHHGGVVGPRGGAATFCASGPRTSGAMTAVVALPASSWTLEGLMTASPGTLQLPIGCGSMRCIWSVSSASPSTPASACSMRTGIAARLTTAHDGNSLTHTPLRALFSAAPSINHRGRFASNSAHRENPSCRPIAGSAI